MGFVVCFILKLWVYQVDIDIGIKGIGEGVEYSIFLIIEKVLEKFIFFW